MHCRRRWGNMRQACSGTQPGVQRGAARQPTAATLQQAPAACSSLPTGASQASGEGGLHAGVAADEAAWRGLGGMGSGGL